MRRRPGWGAGEHCFLQLRRLRSIAGVGSGCMQEHVGGRAAQTLLSFSGNDPYTLSKDLRQELGTLCTEILLQGD